jgi:hypothetical protein
MVDKQDAHAHELTHALPHQGQMVKNQYDSHLHYNYRKYQDEMIHTMALITQIIEEGNHTPQPLSPFLFMDEHC